MQTGLYSNIKDIRTVTDIIQILCLQVSTDKYLYTAGMYLYGMGFVFCRI